MQSSRFLCLVLPSAAMASTTGTYPLPTGTAGIYPNTTVMVTSTTTSAAPVCSVFEILKLPLP